MDNLVHVSAQVQNREQHNDSGFRKLQSCFFGCQLLPYIRVESAPALFGPSAVGPVGPYYRDEPTLVFSVHVVAFRPAQLCVTDQWC